jgi:beta-lactamase regulating signal transducer with metallopeptidase domain
MDALLHGILLVSAKAAGGLLSAIWEGTILAACVALCLRLLTRLSAAARSVIWMAVFLLLMPLGVLPSFGTHEFTGIAFSASPFHLDPRWSVVIAAVWAMLSLWRAAQLAVSAIRLRHLAARATRIHPGAAIEKLLKAGKAGRTAELCTSTEVERPSVFGFFSPRILIPPALFERLNPSELEQVIRHEMEHLRRADDWTNLLQKAGLVLFPLNPALLWVERQLCAERELACDDRVLRSTSGRKTYALCLTRLAEFSMLRRGLSLALGAWEKQSELVRRVHRILRQPNEPMSGKHAMVLTGALIAGVMAVAVALAHSPQLVSFAPLAQPDLQARSVAASGPDTASAPRERNAAEFAGSPTLVKASLPVRPAPATHNSNHRRAAAAKLNVQPPQIFPDQAAWVVLTEWDDDAPPPRVVITVAQDYRSSYAAVAIANGWLIVQI